MFFLGSKPSTIPLFNVCFLLITFTTLSPASITEQIQASLQGVHYILCFDGGGSKTAVQILDAHGTPLFLHQNGQTATTLTGEGSNINTIGQAGVMTCLQNLLNNIIIEPTTRLEDVKAHCLVVGGFAGCGSQTNVTRFKEIFKNLGFPERNLIITSDAALCLEAVPEPGIILIAGTGCICFGKKGTEQFRVGGLGPRIDQGGSGYHVGIDAVRTVLAHDYGWGEPTTLTPIVKEHFNVDDVKSIIAPINGATETIQHIAQLSRAVFEQADKGDHASQGLVQKAADDLGNLLAAMVKTGIFTPCPLYFFGGLFKSSNVSQFIEGIVQTAHLTSWTKTVNMAHKNPTSLVVQRALLSVNHS